MTMSTNIKHNLKKMAVIGAFAFGATTSAYNSVPSSPKYKIVTYQVDTLDTKKPTAAYCTAGKIVQNYPLNSDKKTLDYNQSDGVLLHEQTHYEHAKTHWKDVSVSFE